ncbi:MAG: excinuclease ABC subunit UvrC [Planctomycetota bacterium]
MPISWSSDADLTQVPEQPGVYLFQAADGRVLYVGKAADLRARLRSYRRMGEDERGLIRFMEKDARSVETIVTRTVKEALLLEDSLIKTHKPDHNIRLKDDKSFLMLRLDLDERFPRLKFVRAHSPKAGATGRSRLFGPYASSRRARATLGALHRVVPLRDCPDTVMNHRSRPCLKHPIGLCSAPCVGLIDEIEYAKLVEKAARVLSGDAEDVERDLEARMREASSRREYERAALWRDRLAALRGTLEGQAAVPRDKVRRDVIHLARRGDEAVAHHLTFRDGRMEGSRSHAFRSQLPEDELLHGIVTALYSGTGREVPEELVLPSEPADRALLESVLGAGVKIAVPKGGARARMLELAGENARAELVRREREADSERNALAELATILELDGAPEVIDCFDVSNLQGANVVASRVRFRSGHADKAGYRRFKVRGVKGQDDFASMREIVSRCLRRGVEEGELPDLVVIDGGAQQLASAVEAREEAGAFDVAMIGLAKARSERRVRGKKKEESQERVFVPGRPEAVELATHSAAKHLLERIRDEAHRFAITYHRKERGRITSQLDSIPGIGNAKRKALLVRFGSVQGVKQASIEEIATVPGIGRELANLIRERLRNEASN